MTIPRRAGTLNADSEELLLHGPLDTRPAGIRRLARLSSGRCDSIDLWPCISPLEQILGNVDLITQVCGVRSLTEGEPYPGARGDGSRQCVRLLSVRLGWVQSKRILQQIRNTVLVRILLAKRVQVGMIVGEPNRAPLGERAGLGGVLLRVAGSRRWDLRCLCGIAGVELIEAVLIFPPIRQAISIGVGARLGKVKVDAKRTGTAGLLDGKAIDRSRSYAERPPV